MQIFVKFKDLINKILNIYLFFFSTKKLSLIHDLLIHISLRTQGYKNYGSFFVTGEKNFLKLLKKYNIKLALDIGANIGNYSEEIIKTTNANVISFEPMSKSFRVLNKLKLKYPKKIVAFNLALSDKNGNTNIYYTGDYSELASFEKNINKINYVGKKIKKKKIKTQTLDYFFKKKGKLFSNKIDFIKIDTEGHDFEVLKGARKTINKLNPKFIQFEMNWHFLFSGNNLFKISKEFNNYNFYRLLPYYSGLVKIDPNHPNSNIFHLSNIAMIRKDITI